MFRECRKRVICVGLALLALLGIGWRGYCAGVPFGGEQYLIGAVAAYPADLDRDGDMDLVVPSARVGGEIYSLVWLENDGGAMPQFTRHDILTSSTVPFHSVAVADLDGDGWPDLVPGILSDQAVAWFENDGAIPPVCQARNWPPPNAEEAASVASADLNGDGASDLVMNRAEAPHQLVWYINDGAATPGFMHSAMYDRRYAGQPVLIADLDGDGHQDILGSNRDSEGPLTGDQYLVWLRNDGETSPSFSSGAFELEAWWDVPTTVTSLAAADMDGDGHPDIIENHFTWSRFAEYLEGASAPVYWDYAIDHPASSLSIGSIVPVDLNLDRRIDLFASIELTEQTGHALAWYENNGGSPVSFTEHRIAYVDPPITACFAADLDGDGHPDLITIDRDKVAWRKNLLPNAIPPAQWTLME